MREVRICKVNYFNCVLLDWDGFILEEKQLIPTAAETWAGVSVVAEAVIEHQKRKIPSTRISGNFLFHRIIY